MIKTPAFAYLCGAFLLTSLLGSPPPADAATPPPPKFVVTGKVTENGKPVPGAQVLLDNPLYAGRSDPDSKIATTDSLGTYTFNQVAAGRWSVGCKRSGYNSVGASFQLAASPTQTVNLAIVPILITVTGSVLSPTGQPVFNATVTPSYTLANGGSAAVRTNSYGNYVISTVPSQGKLTLTCDANGHPRTSTVVAISSPWPPPVNISLTR